MKSVELEALDFGHLALFAGMAVNDHVLRALERAGFGSLRPSLGYVVQHLIDGPRSIGELAQLLEITQQAVSKSVREMEEAGYVETVPSEDARVRRVRLSERGHACVRTSRAARRTLEARLEKTCGAKDLARARRTLAEAIRLLGGEDAVKARRVRLPR